MSREIQLDLLSINRLTKDKDTAKEKRKHYLIKGRPRRLKSDCAPITPENWAELSRTLSTGVSMKEAAKKFVIEAQVIKVAVHPSKVKIIDRIREKMDCTRPEAIRTAVIQFVDKHGCGDDLPAPEEMETRKATPGRCEYLKIPFPPEVISAIGHQSTREYADEIPNSSSIPGDTAVPDEIVIPATGLCRAFGCTRQGIINRAIDSWYKQYLD